MNKTHIHMIEVKVLSYQHEEFIRIVGLFDIAMCNEI